MLPIFYTGQPGAILLIRVLYKSSTLAKFNASRIPFYFGRCNMLLLCGNMANQRDYGERVVDVVSRTGIIFREFFSTLEPF